MKKDLGKRAALLCAAAFICLLAACGKNRPSAPGVSSAPAGAGGAPAAASRSIDAFGVVKAKTVHNINLDFPAVLEKKLVSEGQRVKRGDILFRFSSAAHQSQIKAKAYDLSMARLELKKSSMELSRLKEDLLISQRDVEKAKKNLENKESLLALGTASQTEVEEYRKTLTAEEQKMRALERSIESYSGSEVNGLEVQTARIGILESELAELENKARKSFIFGGAIVSDIDDGIVTEIGYTEGDYITTSRKVCALMDMKSLIVEANIPEEFAKDVRVGSKAEIVPVADNSKKYTGAVARISNLAARVGGETVIPVEISVDGKDGFLLPNYNVDVKIF